MNSHTPRVISVFGTKGGVGKTIIAANLAVGFAQFGRRVVLLDVDLQHGGDLAKMFNLKSRESIFSLIPQLPRLEKTGSLKGHNGVVYRALTQEIRKTKTTRIIV